MIDGLYALKRKYGKPAVIKKLVGQRTVNTQTGQITTTYDSVTVNKAILLPVEDVRKIYKVEWLQGSLDHNTRVMIVDIDDSGILNTNTKVVYNSKTYDVEAYTLLESNYYMLTLKETDNA